MDYESLADQLIDLVAAVLRRSPTRKVMEMAAGESGVLTYLCCVHNGASAGELSRELFVSTGGIANSLKKLEAKELVERRQDPADHRRIGVYLSEKGESFGHYSRRLVLAETKKLLQELGERDAQELTRLVGRVIEISMPEQA